MTANSDSAAVETRAPLGDERDSMSSSDDTVFLDLPLPPVPGTARAVRIQNMDDSGVPFVGSCATYVLFDGGGGGESTARLYSRMDGFDVAPRQSPERCSSSVSLASGSSGRSAATETLQQRTSSSRWSSSDEDASFYRERLSQYRCAGCSNGMNNNML